MDKSGDRPSPIKSGTGSDLLDQPGSVFSVLFPTFIGFEDAGDPVVFVDLARGVSKGKGIAMTINILAPNAPTRFDQFIQEVFLPGYNSTNQTKLDDRLAETMP